VFQYYYLALVDGHSYIISDACWEQGILVPRA